MDKAVKINQESHKILQKIADSMNTSKSDIANQMISYCYQNTKFAKKEIVIEKNVIVAK